MATPTVTLNANAYYTGLVNFILFMRLYATNTSNRPKNLVDELCTETLEYGDRKAYPFAELPDVEDYSLTSSLLTDKPIKYTEEFIGGDPIQKKISLSTIEPYMKMAMMSSSGVTSFFAYIVGLMDSAKYDYLYNQIMTDLLTWTPSVSTGKKMNQSIGLIQTDNMTSAQEIMAAQQINQMRIEAAIQKTYDDFSLFSDIFIDIDNATDDTNFKTAVDKSDLLFIGNAKYLNDQIINWLSQLLKPDLINSNFKNPTVIKIPQTTFDGNSKSSVMGIICHKHWYQWFYRFNFMGSFLDVDTVRLKRVLHFWYNRGRLKNLPASQISVTYSPLSSS